MAESVPDAVEEADEAAAVAYCKGSTAEVEVGRLEHVSWAVCEVSSDAVAMGNVDAFEAFEVMHA